MTSSLRSVRRLLSAAVAVGLLLALTCPPSAAAVKRDPRASQKARREGVKVKVKAKAKAGGRWPRWQEGDVRLVRGRTRSAGTVLLFHQGKWGAVCDDLWDPAASDVACRQRGFPGSARPAFKSEFGGRERRKCCG